MTTPIDDTENRVGPRHPAPLSAWIAPWLFALPLAAQDAPLPDEAQVHTEESFRFLAMPAGWIVGLVLVPLIAVFGWWCYASLVRLERPTRILLSSLRTLALILCMLLLFQPAMERTRYTKIRSQVHVLVDDSASMGRRDTYAGTDELRALSDAAGTDPSGLNRAALVDRVLSKPGGLLEALAEDHDVQLYRFSRKPIPMQGLDELAARGPRTHIGDALDLHLAGSGSLNLDGIVLISDGRSNTGLDPVEAAAKYRLQDVPIHALGVGDPTPPRNVWVIGPSGPKQALAEEEVAFDVAVRAEGLEGRMTSVTLRGSRDGGPYQPLASTSVSLVADGQPVVARLYHAFEREGDWTLRFEADHLPEESSYDDNEDVRFLRVDDEKIRALFIDDVPRWSYRYIKNGLKRVDPSIEVQVYLCDASPIFIQEHSKTLEPLAQLPRTREELMDYHVILLGDVPPERLGGTEEAIDQWLQALVEFTESGGGVGFLFGEAAMPERYRRTPVEDLLPVVLENPTTLEQMDRNWSQPFHTIVEDFARPHEIMTLLRDPRQNRQLWEVGFRPFYGWHPVLRAKPGASVLMRHDTAENRFGKRVIAAARDYPRGRTFWLGTDETWRWRDPYGDKYEDAFYRNVVRWLAAGRVARRDEHVELNVDKVQLDTGDRVRLSLLVHDDEFHPSVAREHAVFVRRADEEAERRTLRAVIGEPGHYEGSVTLDEPGAVSFLVFANDNPADAVLARQDVLVKIPDRELAQSNLDPETLQRVAQASGGGDATGGTYRPLSEADDLAELFAGRRQVDTPLETTQRPLWDSGWALGLLLLILGAEWILRKRSRLV